MAVNKHLTHLEELILTKGTTGAEEALAVLKNVGSTLSPSGGAPVTITTKWDGAPAVICGIDPADGKFFVGTKGVFAQNPKMAKSQSDVQRMYDGALAAKLTTCFNTLQPVVTRGILQGDLLFTNDKSTASINGKTYITFRPNTLTYAAERGTKIASEIQAAELGIVFHTKYTGSSMQTLQASYGVTESDYNKSPNVWVTAASFQNVGGVATFTPDEYQQYVKAVNIAEGSYKQARNILTKIQSGGKSLQFDTVFLQFFNSFYRQGSPIPPVDATFNAFVHFLAGQYNKNIENYKTLKSQADKAFKFVEALDFINENKQQMRMLIATYMNLTRAKMILVNKMNKVAALDAFVETTDGYRVTNQEGFVAVDGPKAVKLVDRLEFSNLNFNLPKNWG